MKKIDDVFFLGGRHFFNQKTSGFQVFFSFFVSLN